MGPVSAGFSNCPCFSRSYGHEGARVSQLAPRRTDSWPVLEDFSKLARYAPDDVATDAAKQEKFLEGLNDELSMQLMVATFNNYQELVDRALMIERKQQQIENRKRKYGQGKYNSGAQQKPRFTPRLGGHF